MDARARRLKVLFRLTPEEVDKINSYQCRHKIYKLLLGKRNSIDHRHSDGLIRGQLDWLLNRAYGLIEKVGGDRTSSILRALAVYHDSPPAVKALGEKRYGLIGKAKYKKKMVYGPNA